MASAIFYDIPNEILEFIVQSLVASHQPQGGYDCPEQSYAVFRESKWEPRAIGPCMTDLKALRLASTRFAKLVTLTERVLRTIRLHASPLAAHELGHKEAEVASIAPYVRSIVFTRDIIDWTLTRDDFERISWEAFVTKRMDGEGQIHTMQLVTTISIGKFAKEAGLDELYEKLYSQEEIDDAFEEYLDAAMEHRHMLVGGGCALIWSDILKSLPRVEEVYFSSTTPTFEEPEFGFSAVCESFSSGLNLHSAVAQALVNAAAEAISRSGVRPRLIASDFRGLTLGGSSFNFDGWTKLNANGASALWLEQPIESRSRGYPDLDQSSRATKQFVDILRTMSPQLEFLFLAFNDESESFFLDLHIAADLPVLGNLQELHLAEVILEVPVLVYWMEGMKKIKHIVLKSATLCDTDGFEAGKDFWHFVRDLATLSRLQVVQLALMSDDEDCCIDDFVYLPGSLKSHDTEFETVGQVEIGEAGSLGRVVTNFLCGSKNWDECFEEWSGK